MSCLAPGHPLLPKEIVEVFVDGNALLLVGQLCGRNCRFRKMLLFLYREGVEFSRRLEASIEQNFTSQIIPYTCKEGLVEEEVAQLSPPNFLF